MKNLFDTAAPLEAVKKAASKNQKAVIKIDGLRSVAALDAAEKAIKGLKEGLRASVDAQILDRFVNEGAKSGRQPDNFRGVEADASASCELRKRSNRSPLDELEIKILAENKVPLEEIADKASTFVINPKYLEDSVLMDKVGKVLGKVPGMPEDFIVRQEAQVRTVVSDDSLKAVFAGDPAKIAELLRVVGVIALKPTLESTDLAEALELIKGMVAEDNDGVEDALAASLEDAKLEAAKKEAAKRLRK